MAWWYVDSKKLKEELYKSWDLFHRVLVVSTNVMKKKELCEEPKELKEEKDSGVTAEMAKKVDEAKKSPPKVLSLALPSSP